VEAVPFMIGRLSSSIQVLGSNGFAETVIGDWW
jgi:hypothetical protein